MFTKQPERPHLRLTFGPKHQTWWAPIFRGLVVDKTAKHYQALHTAVWLLLYLILHANRSTGKSFRTIKTIGRDMAVSDATIKRWLSTLSRSGYVYYFRKGNVLQFEVRKWKPLRRMKY